MALHMADLFEHAARPSPERLAVACGDREVTYSQLEDQANRLAHHLAALGVGPGDHIGLYARNSVPAVVTLLAAYKLRAVVANINYRYIQNELAFLVQDADLAALVYDRPLAPIVADAVPAELPRVEIDGDFDDVIAQASGERDFGPR